MPRNSSGIYTLPQAPFVSGTVISSTAMNSNLSDIATALTGSLPIAGGAPMTAPLWLASGSVTTPGLSFNSSQSSGFYLAGANQWGFSIAGVNSALFNSDLSVTWAGAASWAGNISTAGNLTTTGTGTIGTNLSVGGTATVTGALTAASITLTTSALSLFQCKLSLSGSNLLLAPYNGNFITINGVTQIIPSAGVTLNNGTTSASTFYYIYAYMNSGTMTLEASTTAYTASTTYGYSIKTGDATRTLVGAAYSPSGNVWTDSLTNRLVISYYNRRAKSGFNFLTADTVSSSGTLLEVTSSLRINFISWTDEIVPIELDAFAAAAVASSNAGTPVAIAIDSTTAPGVALSAPAGGVYIPLLAYVIV